jgi:hypothetical protein
VAEIETLPLGTDDEQDLILSLINKPSGSREKFKKRWIEFDCQKGVHHGKYATYENGKRKRVQGGHLGRLDKVQAEGHYAVQRVRDFIDTHDCHYPERFDKDLDECGISKT